MLQRLLIALNIAVLGVLASTGVSEAAKGPDASDVALGTLVVVLCSMAFLSLVFLVKRALGGVTELPPEEPATGGHH
jgi:hypothetical protein